jgi:hypothetical protein
MHCPVIACTFVANARDAAVAHESIEDHVLRCHWPLTRTL